MSRVLFGAVVSAIGVLAGSASAGISIQGNIPASTEQTGANYSGTIDYSGAGSSGILTISLTNASAGTGGYLTAFVFNISSIDPLASASLSSGPTSDWGILTNVNGAPFGTFDSGSSTGGSFEGGGPPSRGLAVGASGTWIFNISASDAGLLTPQSFITGSSAQNFVARFRGLTNGGSDKVPVQAVPTPGALTMLSVAGFIAARRRRA